VKEGYHGVFHRECGKACGKQARNECRRPILRAFALFDHAAVQRLYLIENVEFESIPFFNYKLRSGRVEKFSTETV
jgi:hypothetical protein